MTPLPRGLVQPDARSCGAASLVAARMLLDPAYAALVTTGDRFAAETLGMHRRVTGAVALDGRLQLPDDALAALGATGTTRVVVDTTPDGVVVRRAT